MLLPRAAIAEDVNKELGASYLDTPDLRLVWFEGLEYLAPHAVRTFTNSLAWQRRMLGWEPSERTTVLLRDWADYGNALAMSAPRNYLAFDVAPLSHAFETYPASERLYTLMNHELVHVAQGDLANSDDRAWRRFFLGKVAPRTDHPESLLYGYLTVPGFTIPRWMSEGSATFVETWMSGGLGRGQGGYDEMMFRAMVRDGAHFYDPLGLESRGVRADFQVGVNAYLYGTRFLTWLAYAHSPEKVLAWIRRDEGSERYYASRFAAVFGLPLDAAWARWVAFEQEFQKANLAAIRTYPVTPHRQLVDSALGNISRVHFDEATGTLYGGFKTPGVYDYIGALDTRTGIARRLADVKRGMLYRVTSFAFDRASGTAFYTTDNTSYRDLMAVDVRTGQSRKLIEDVRTGEIAFNPADRSLLGIQHVFGRARLVHIPYPYTEWRTVHQFPYGVVPYDLDISPDGSLLSASVGELNGDQFLRVWDLKGLATNFLAQRSEFRFGQSVPESFVFSPDGRYLYGSSFYTGVSNIFRYEVATGAVEAVSNTDVGFFRPFPLADGRLLVLAYTANGFVPATIDPVPVKDASAIRFLGTELARKHPVVTTWQVDPPTAVDDEKLATQRGGYEPAKHLALNNAYPVLQGYKDALGAGYHVNIADPTGYTAIGITAAFTPGQDIPGNERAHFEVKGHYLEWSGSLSWNRSDFYDLFGPVKRSRKGFAAKGAYNHFVIYDDPRTLEFVARGAFYDRIDTLPYAQNVESGFDRLTEAEVGLRYVDVRRALGAVDEEKGLKWDAFTGLQHVTGETPWHVRGSIEYGWDLPARNSSLWLRTAAGYISGNRDVPIANFYFGGFGNNYVDSREVKRYREPFSFPGFGIDEISGQSFVRPLLEWNITPYYFESVGTPSFHLASLRPALFVSGLWTDVESAAERRDYQNAGAQLDLNFTALHWYPMTLSVGYAVGFRGGKRAGDEFMLSLKIM
ncbi:MAG TPA: hypothetical protein VFX05_03445 [Casimicrobiaceae bacterium]|nr:hypothetical protein [Casimicrobiaceae bacterium]